MSHLNLKYNLVFQMVGALLNFLGLILFSLQIILGITLSNSASFHRALETEEIRKLVR